MKNLLKITLLSVALVLMSGCSAQKRAERNVRRAVELCPELVQAKAHCIDTVLTVGPFADCAPVPLAPVLRGDTIYAATEHGTVVVSLRQSDSALRVGFVAAPQKVHYKDTITYSQVVVPEPQPKQSGGGFWNRFFLIIACLGVVMSLGSYVLIRILKLKK